MEMTLHNKHCKLVIEINGSVLTFNNVLITEDSDNFITFEDPKNDNKLRRFNKNVVREVIEI
jgi:hypothetical protein